MIQLILMLSVSPIQPLKTAQASPCNWPNKCAVEAPVVVASCGWPNVCAKQTPIIVAQASTCNWPNRCEKSESVINL